MSEQIEKYTVQIVFSLRIIKTTDNDIVNFISPSKFSKKWKNKKNDKKIKNDCKIFRKLF